ncbi:hypothetical protein [Brooklawnia cerclae]|uniref:Transposase n=1 Tax=Brooklawnia cerclae TaxID=349934 RepID=A0ABX0SJ82_9ACTN|nr:hypothetical protein [Brooklawnia cerclae]NIH58452.1 hypothetical protein [Brooklawnia cerclae]
MPDEYLRPPLNAVRPPAGMHRGHEGTYASELVLARLVWRDCVEVVPARLSWICDDRIRVEWTDHGRTRRTWLPFADVRRKMRWREGQGGPV